MGSRRVAALRALAERGATEGEREAARKALAKHETTRKSRAPTPPRDVPNWFADPLSWFARAPHWTCPESPKPRTQPTTGAKLDSADSTRVLIEVSTNAEMHTRFIHNNPEGLTFVWCGKVCKATRLRGHLHDHARSMFFVIANVKDLVQA